MWLKTKQEGLCRYSLTRVPVWDRFFEPQPSGPRALNLSPQAAPCLPGELHRAQKVHGV